MRFLIFILLFMPYMAFANIASTSYVQKQIADQIATAVANKADKTSVDSLSETIGNFPNYSVFGSGWNIVYSGTIKEPGWPHDFLGNTTWNIPTNIGEVIEMLLGKETVYDGLLHTAFAAIFTKLSSLTRMITDAQTVAETAKSKADTNATAMSSKVDTAASAKQTMAGSYTVSGTLNLTGVATVETPPLPSAE